MAVPKIDKAGKTGTNRITGAAAAYVRSIEAWRQEGRRGPCPVARRVLDRQHASLAEPGVPRGTPSRPSLHNTGFMPKEGGPPVSDVDLSAWIDAVLAASTAEV